MFQQWRNIIIGKPLNMHIERSDVQDVVKGIDESEQNTLDGIAHRLGNLAPGFERNIRGQGRFKERHHLKMVSERQRLAVQIEQKREHVMMVRQMLSIQLVEDLLDNLDKVEFRDFGDG